MEVELGQKVYVVGGSVNRGKTVPCNVCFGKLRVVVILGNGTKVSVSCEACNRGFEGPSGTHQEYGPGTFIREVVVNSIKLTENGKKPDIKIYSDEHLFYSKEAAKDFERELKKDLAIRSEKWTEDSFKRETGKTTWSAHYHLKEVERHQRKIDWHQTKVREKIGEGEE